MATLKRCQDRTDRPCQEAHRRRCVKAQNHGYGDITKGVEVYIRKVAPLG